MYLITAHKKGISSVQLAKDLGVTQKTAWFMLHRIRESLKDKGSDLLTGTIEIDESYIGGNVKNMSKKKREGLKNRYNPQLQKQGLMGLVERGGKLKVSLIEGKDYNGGILKEMVRKAVATQSIVITDGFGGYAGLGKEYAQHEVINHAKQEFVRGIYHTNTIEGFWSFLKRSLYGIYHQVSVKHLQAYCNENAYRYNTRDLKDGNRFEVSLQHITGTLPYKQLVYGKSNQTDNTKA
jgi:transposase-like protein